MLASNFCFVAKLDAIKKRWRNLAKVPKQAIHTDPTNLRTMGGTKCTTAASKEFL